MTNLKYKIVQYASGVLIAAGAMLATTQVAQAGVTVKVNLTTQRMNVSVDGRHYATWKVSTGRRGYTTPTGRYRIQRMTTMHYSSQYNNSPMPYSVFYHRGYAIHGTKAVSRLGRVASHGCVRLDTKHAANLYRLIKSKGHRNTKITVFRGKRISKKRLNRRDRLSSAKHSNRVTYRFENKRRVKVATNNSKPFFIFGGLDLND